jgi:hypothetical protein
MKILEYRLILNVTVLASEPDEHLADREPLKHGVVHSLCVLSLSDNASTVVSEGALLCRGAAWAA